MQDAYQEKPSAVFLQRFDNIKVVSTRHMERINNREDNQEYVI